MRNRIALALIFALAIYIFSQAIAQFVADKTFDDYSWHIVSMGQNVPGTTLDYAGSDFAASSDYNESVTPHFLDVSSGNEVDFGPLVENDELTNGVVFGEVIIDSNEFELIGVAITVGVPRTPRGTFASRLLARMINPFGGE